MTPVLAGRRTCLFACKSRASHYAHARASPVPFSRSIISPWAVAIILMGLEAWAVVVGDEGEIKRVSDPAAERVYRTNIEAQRDEAGAAPNRRDR
jgi:hypothetical protein